MPRGKSAAIPATPRMTLLQWIELDDGDPTSSTHPDCSVQAQALHTRIVFDPSDSKSQTPEPLQPPAGLRLAPLG
ncbi:hypothetical protein D9M73_97830 [compost metagenome]|jgi:hypothetical protein